MRYPPLRYYLERVLRDMGGVSRTGPLSSGKKKAHKQKSFWPVTTPVTGGVSRPGGQGSEIYVLCSEPKEHKSFCPDTRPGRPVTGVNGQSFM